MGPTTVDILAAALAASASAQTKRHPSNDGDKTDKGDGPMVWSCLGRCGYTVSPRNMPVAMSRDGGKWSIDQFHLDKQLYEGRTSCLFLATDKQSGTPVALKCYHKQKLSSMNRRQVEREVIIHLNLKHKHIIKLYASFEDRKSVFLVLEPATCDLFQRLKRDGGTFTEQRCRDSVVQVLSACLYLHSKGVVLRDIKPENILLSPSSELKMADFGLSINAHAERPITRLGTLEYMAPEVIRCPQKREGGQDKSRPDLVYSTGVDVWALGVLVYELLTGSTPFTKRSRSETCEQILAAGISFPNHVSDQAVSFIRAALHKDARSRPTVQQLLAHPWLTEGRTADDPEPATAPATPAGILAAIAVPVGKLEPASAPQSPRIFSGSLFMHPVLDRSAFSKGRAWEVADGSAATDLPASTSVQSCVKPSPAGTPAVDVPGVGLPGSSARELPGPELALAGSRLQGEGDSTAVWTMGDAGKAGAAAAAAETAPGDGAEPASTLSAARASSSEASHATDGNALDRPRQVQQPGCSAGDGVQGLGAEPARIQSMGLECSSGCSTSLFKRHRSLWAAARGNTAAKEQGLRPHRTQDPGDGRCRLEGRQDPGRDMGTCDGLGSWGNELWSGENVCSRSSSGSGVAAAATRPPPDGVLSEGHVAAMSPQALGKAAAAGAGAGTGVTSRLMPHLSALLVNLKSCPAPHVTSPKPPTRELNPEGLLGRQPSLQCPIHTSATNSSRSCGGGAAGMASPTAEPRSNLHALLAAPRPRPGLPMLSLSCSSVQAWENSDPALPEAARSPVPSLTSEATAHNPEADAPDAAWHSVPLPVLRQQQDRSLLLQPSGWLKTPAIRSPGHHNNMHARSFHHAASSPVPSEHHVSLPGNLAAEYLGDWKAAYLAAGKQPGGERRRSQHTGPQSGEFRGVGSALQHTLTRRSRALSSSSGLHCRGNAPE